MKNCIRYITLLIIFVFWIFPCETEEPTTYYIEKLMNDALVDMDYTLQKLSEKYDEFKSEHPMGEALWSALKKSKENAKIIFMFTFTSEINYSELFQLFLSTLEYDTEVFRRFVQFTNTGRIPLFISSPEVSEVLDASIDLELKAELIQKSHKYWVEVKVNTKNKQGEEINNCIVWYAPFYLKDEEQYKIKFDKLSTPTIDSIPAGYWAIWTEKEGKLGIKWPFRGGDDGRWKREIDIFSPE